MNHKYYENDTYSENSKDDELQLRSDEEMEDNDVAMKEESLLPKQQPARVCDSQLFTQVLPIIGKVPIRKFFLLLLFSFLCPLLRQIRRIEGFDRA